MDIKAIAVTGAAYLILLVLLWKTGKGKIRNREKESGSERESGFSFLSTQSAWPFLYGRDRTGR